jgi:hypothetical protein
VDNAAAYRQREVRNDKSDRAGDAPTTPLDGITPGFSCEGLSIRRGVAAHHCALANCNPLLCRPDRDLNCIKADEFA